jgi:hypothetical protein
MKTILFVCIGNSGHSQMAEALFNNLAKGKATVLSAGTYYTQGAYSGQVEKADRVIIMGSPKKAIFLCLNIYTVSIKGITTSM